jgi:hypothetical protein
MAARYWVGGTASWDATAGTKWALTSGGAGGQAVPTSSDDVFLDAASGAVTVTIAATSTCLSLDCTGFTGTLAGSAALSVAGNFTLSTGMTRTYTGALSFTSTSIGRTLTFNGKTTASTVDFTGTGGGWTVQDAWDNGTSNITVTRATFNTNNQAITCGTFTSSNTNTRSVTLGTSTMTISSWAFANVTGLTFSGASSTIVVKAGGGTFAGGGLT